MSFARRACVHLRLSAVSYCLNSFFAETSARIERFDFRRASSRWIPGAS
jgi:hypothetical protein